MLNPVCDAKRVYRAKLNFPFTGHNMSCDCNTAHWSTHLWLLRCTLLLWGSVSLKLLSLGTELVALCAKVWPWWNDIFGHKCVYWPPKSIIVDPKSLAMYSLMQLIISSALGLLWGSGAPNASFRVLWTGWSFFLTVGCCCGCNQSFSGLWYAKWFFMFDVFPVL